MRWLIALALAGGCHRQVLEPPRAADAAEEASAERQVWGQPRLIAQIGHPGPASAAVFTDGRYAVTAGEDGRVLLWDTRSGGRRLRLLHAHPRPLVDVCWGTGDTILLLDDAGALTRISLAGVAEVLVAGSGDGQGAVAGLRGPVQADVVAIAGQGGDVVVADAGGRVAVTRGGLTVPYKVPGAHVLGISSDRTVWIGTEAAVVGVGPTGAQTMFAVDGPVLSVSGGAGLVAVGTEGAVELFGVDGRSAWSHPADRPTVAVDGDVVWVVDGGVLRRFGVADGVELPPVVDVVGPRWVEPLPEGALVGTPTGAVRIDPSGAVLAAFVGRVEVAAPWLAASGDALLTPSGSGSLVWDLGGATPPRPLPEEVSAVVTAGSSWIGLGAEGSPVRMDGARWRGAPLLDAVALAGAERAAVVAVLSSGGAVAIHDVARQELTARLSVPQPVALALSPDGDRLVVLTALGDLFWWVDRPATGWEQQAITRLPLAQVDGLRWTSNGLWAWGSARARSGVRPAVWLLLPDLRGGSPAVFVDAPVTDVLPAPDGAWVATVDGQVCRQRAWLVSNDPPCVRAPGDFVQRLAWLERGWLAGLGGGGFTWLWDAEQASLVGRVLAYPGGWAVTDPAGRYDALDGGSGDALHFLVRSPDGPPEPAPLSALKSVAFEPALLRRLLGVSRQAPVEFALPAIPPRPELAAALVRSELAGGRPLIEACVPDETGRVAVRVNGREVSSDLAVEGAALAVEHLGRCEGGEAYRLDASLAPTWRATGANAVALVPISADGSRAGFAVQWTLAGRRGIELMELAVAEPPSPPRLFALVVGVGEYGGDVWDLAYPEADAGAVASLLEAGMSEVFAAGSSVRLLRDGDEPVTRAALLAAVEDAARDAGPDDVLVVFLAGHGVVVDEQWYFLASDAPHMQVDADHPQGAVSASELGAALATSRAVKQLLVLDTCASGTAAELLAVAGGVPREMRAELEAVKDRVGAVVLSASAATASAYEDPRIGHGVLTYSVLDVLLDPGALHDGALWDVDQVTLTTLSHVPDVGRWLGIDVQYPVIARPPTQGFAIGKLPERSRMGVDLSAFAQRLGPVTLVERDRWVDFYDLGPALDKGLGDSVMRAWSGDRPGVFRLGGVYDVDGEQLAVEAALYMGEELVEQREVSGTPDAVVRLLAEWLKARLGVDR